VAKVFKKIDNGKNDFRFKKIKPSRNGPLNKYLAVIPKVFSISL
jgi:hypothetical protein